MQHRVIEKKVLIGGAWTESESGERFEVHYPGDGGVIGTVPKCTRKDVQHAVQGAMEGQKRLAEFSLTARVNLLYRAMEIAERRDKESSEIACMESGKVIREATSEASTLQGYSWSNFRVAAENVKIHRGMTIPNTTEDSNHKRIIVNREPVGVVVNISTFSYPSEMPNCTIPYALALGNAVIVKPSRGAPLSAVLICEILEEAGFPPGSVSVLTGPGSEIGDELVSHPDTNAVNFFGQAETGERITQRAGIKKLLLALVSNNPLIVMDDANIDEAVGALVGGCFNLAGQSPISTRRILVHKDVHQPFVARLVEKTKGLRMADPLDENTDVGPVNNKVVLDEAMRHLDDAKKKGGTFLAGGKNPKGLFVEPTVIDEATPEMLVVQEPTPGPIAPILTFGSIEEAVALANGTRYGFQTGAFTSSLANAFYLGEKIKAGGVYINEATNCWEEMAPFGGIKRSGLGRMLSTWILDELTETKLTLFDLSKVKKQ